MSLMYEAVTAICIGVATILILEKNISVLIWEKWFLKLTITEGTVAWTESATFLSKILENGSRKRGISYL